MDFLVIIPAFNAEKEIEGPLRQLVSIVKNPQKIVVVDDGSNDLTSQIADQYKVVLLKHAKNRGKGAALKTGFEFARKKRIKWIFTLDSDNQHNPKQIPVFLRKLHNNHFDLLIGKRKIQIDKMPFDRYLSNKITSLLLSIKCKIRIYDTQCGYRLINTDFLKKLKLKTDRFETESELLIKFSRAGAKIGQIPISTIYAKESSNIDRMTDTLRFLKMYFNQTW